MSLRKTNLAPSAQPVEGPSEIDPLRRVIIRLSQIFTSGIQIKGVHKLITHTGGALFRPETEYSVYNNIKLRIDSTVAMHCLNVLNYSGHEAVKTFEVFLNRGDVYVDVGANLGYMALNAEQIVGPQGTVIALEPDSKTLPLLKKNKRINNSKIIIVEKAATDHQGVDSFHIAAESGQSRLCNSKQNLHGMVHLTDIHVPTDTLDHIVAEFVPGQRVTFIKIDVEGHELRVLQGATGLLTNDRPAIFMEINHGALAQNDIGLKDLVKYLQGFSYVPYYVNSHAADWFRLGRTPTYRPMSGRLDKFMSKPFDMLALHKGVDIPAHLLDRAK